MRGGIGSGVDYLSISVSIAPTSTCRLLDDRLKDVRGEIGSGVGYLSVSVFSAPSTTSGLLDDWLKDVSR